MIKKQNELSEIIKDRLYLTSLAGARSIDLVISKNINIIVSVMDYDPFVTNTEKYSHINFVYFKADDDDDFNISQYFEQFEKILYDNPDKRILIHCYAGASRSATLVMAFLMKDLIVTNKKKLLNRVYTIDRLLNKVKKIRNVVDPNDGFIKQLTAYRQKLIEEN